MVLILMQMIQYELQKQIDIIKKKEKNLLM